MPSAGTVITGVDWKIMTTTLFFSQVGRYNGNQFLI